VHGRTIHITIVSISACIFSHDWLTQLACLQGAFTPNGLTLLDSLAQRGAHIIALTSDASSTSTSVSLLRATTMRTSTQNSATSHHLCLFAPSVKTTASRNSAWTRSYLLMNMHPSAMSSRTRARTLRSNDRLHCVRPSCLSRYSSLCSWLHLSSVTYVSSPSSIHFTPQR
jgi:hypothetical protein